MISNRDLYHSTMQVDVMSRRIGREREVRGRRTCISRRDSNRMQLPNTPENIPISLAALPFYDTMGANAFILHLFVAPTTLIILPQWNIDLVIKTLLQ
jgi:hypothetical protein